MSGEARGVAESIFEPADGARFVPTEAALGPWTDQALHGGPPAMLMARAIERSPSEGEVFVARLTVELLRPIGRDPLAVRCRLVRPGRKVQLIEASLWREETEVARATALRIRRAEVDVPEPLDPLPHPFVEDASAWDPPYPSRRGYHTDGVEIRTAGVGAADRGPMWGWFRLRVPLVPGEEPSPLVRVCAAADFPNGISYVVDPRRVTYVNPDLTVSLHRLPIGEWVLVDARTWAEPHGVGMSVASLYDRSGELGRSVQSLLLEPLR
jgi:hypothetical protein